MLLVVTACAAPQISDMIPANVKLAIAAEDANTRRSSSGKVSVTDILAKARNAEFADENSAPATALSDNKDEGAVDNAIALAEEDATPAAMTADRLFARFMNTQSETTAKQQEMDASAQEKARQQLRGKLFARTPVHTGSLGASQRQPIDHKSAIAGTTLAFSTAAMSWRRKKPTSCARWLGPATMAPELPESSS